MFISTVQKRNKTLNGSQRGLIQQITYIWANLTGEKYCQNSC